jgi:LysM repeat protein
MNRILTLFVVLFSMIFAMSTSAAADVDYTVKRGDSMFHVGKKFGVPGQEVVRANPSFRDPNLIHPGDKLVIPGRVRVPAGVPAITSPVSPTVPRLPANMREAAVEQTLAGLQARLSGAEEKANALQQRHYGL